MEIQLFVFLNMKFYTKTQLDKCLFEECEIKIAFKPRNFPLDFYSVSSFIRL